MREDGPAAGRAAVRRLPETEGISAGVAAALPEPAALPPRAEADPDGGPEASLLSGRRLVLAPLLAAHAGRIVWAERQRVWIRAWTRVRGRKDPVDGEDGERMTYGM